MVQAKRKPPATAPGVFDIQADYIVYSTHVSVTTTSSAVYQ